MTDHPSGSRAGAGADRPAIRHLLVAAVSALLSYLLTQTPEGYTRIGTDWGPGLVFGVLALAPAVRSWWRRAGLVAASALIYRGAVEIATWLAAGQRWPEVGACALAGGLAAPVLALVALPLAGRRSGGGRHLLALAFGAAGGALIGFAVSGSDDQLLHFHLPLAAGYLVWQVGWTAVHGPRRGGRAEVVSP